MNANVIARKKNHLKKVEEILKIYKQHKFYDTPNTVIWKKHIYPIYFISLSQFNNYLNMNISQELKNLNNYEHTLFEN